MKILSILIFIITVSAPCWAESEVKGEKIDLKALQKDYWSGQQSTQVEAVQNRLYTKANKFEFGLFAASIATDPFLNVVAGGASLGYFFSEHFSVKAFYFRDSVTLSSAHVALTQNNNIIANTNLPRDFVGAEMAFFPLYGKLSLMGKAIFYGDTFLLLGGGLRGTETGRYQTALAGLGAQLYVSRFFSLRLDYRLMYFEERVLQKFPAELVGTDLGTRTEISSLVTFGVTFLLGL